MPSVARTFHETRRPHRSPLGCTPTASHMTSQQRFLHASPRRPAQPAPTRTHLPSYLSLHLYATCSSSSMTNNRGHQKSDTHRPWTEDTPLSQPRTIIPDATALHALHQQPGMTRPAYEPADTCSRLRWSQEELTSKTVYHLSSSPLPHHARLAKRTHHLPPQLQRLKLR